MAKTNAELLKEIELLKGEVECFKSDYEEALSTNEHLKNDLLASNESNGELTADNDLLKEENAALQELLQSQDNPSASGVPLTRNDIIKGLLPNLPLNTHDAEAHVGNLLNCADILLKKING